MLKIGLITSIATALCGCTPRTPFANDVDWRVSRSADKKTYAISGRAVVGANFGGWYQPVVTLVDDRGCRHVFKPPETHVPAKSGQDTTVANIKYEAALPRPVASADLSIIYESAPPGATRQSEVSQDNVFHNSRVVDASVKVPTDPENPCGKPQQKRPQKNAARTSEGADAKAIDNMGRGEIVAAAINSAGFLCARVTDMYPRGGSIIAHCTEYRNGRGKVKYLIDAAAGEVTQLE